MSGIRCPNLVLESNVWNQMSKSVLGIKCPESGVQIVFGIKCLESGVLESHVRNQVSGIDFGIRCLGITCLGIRCPELILESGVRICFGIRCLGITRPESHVLESGVHFSLGIKCHWESHVIAPLETSVVWNWVSGYRFPESNVRDTNVLESNETHPPRHIAFSKSWR